MYFIVVSVKSNPFTDVYENSQLQIYVTFSICICIYIDTKWSSILLLNIFVAFS